MKITNIMSTPPEWIEVEIKYNYGVANVYPVCYLSRLLAELAGTKTLTRQAIETIKKMGIVIVVVNTVKEL